MPSSGRSSTAAFLRQLLPDVMPMTSDTILETRNLRKEFNGFVAVNDVNLKIDRHSIHALIGPNGAGKTTCFNLITRFQRQSKGSIWFDGHDLSHVRPNVLPHLGIARNFQISHLYPHLSVLENVRLGLQGRQGKSFCFWRSERVLSHLDDEAMALLKYVGLDGFAQRTAVELSYGSKRALEIAATIALKPTLLLLDEPMAGLGREDVGRMTDLVRQVADGRTVVMVEHNLSVVAELSDTITVLQHGEVLAEGAYDDIAANPAVIEAYLGTSHD